MIFRSGLKDSVNQTCVTLALGNWNMKLEERKLLSIGMAHFSSKNPPLHDWETKNSQVHQVRGQELDDTVLLQV